MGAGHGHTHGAPTSAGAAHRSRLVAVLGLTAVVLVAEVVGAWLTGSLALLADAGHMATDAAGILLAVLAVTFASRPATPQRTYGYYRLEILAAVANAVLLMAVAVYVLVEAWRRWQSPSDVDGPLMLVFALVGLAANVVGVVLLRAGSRESLNVRGAYLEVVGDALGSVAVIVAAVLVWAFGWVRADVLASVAVAVMILPRVWSLLRDAIDVLLQATPKDVDIAAVREHLLGTDGVVGVHDLHVWALTSGVPVMSVHVVCTDDALHDGGGARVLDALCECLADHFDVEHCTFQLEPATHRAHESATHA